jgi:hypothetical protein
MKGQYVEHLPEAVDSYSAVQEISRLFLWIPKVHCRVHKSLPLNPIPNQFNSLFIL